MGSKRYVDGGWVTDDPTDSVPADLAAVVAWVDGDLARAQIAWEAEMRRPATRDELERMVLAVAGGA